MQVLRLCWLGIPTREYAQMLRLFRDVMGLDVEFELPTTVELSIPASDDRVQLFKPGDAYFEFFAEHSNGPVALFEVDDVRRARSELVAAGIEIVGSLERDSEWEWLHVRADGNVYELASRLAPPPRPAQAT